MSNVSKSKDTFVENEREYSMQPYIDRVTEWDRFNTATQINKLQKGFVPNWLPITFEKTFQYFENEEEKISRKFYEVCIKISGLRNTKVLNEENRFYSGNMKDLFKKGLVQGFLVFVDRFFIPWDRLTVIHSDQNDYLLIEGMDRDIIIDEVRILHIPNNMRYIDDDCEPEDANVLFHFTHEGRLSMSDADIFVVIDDPHVYGWTYFGKLFLYNTGIPADRKLSNDNVIIFDKFGGLYTKANVTITNNNVLSIEQGRLIDSYAVIFWSDLSNNNEAPTIRALNHEYVRELIQGITGANYIMSKDFLKDFDFEFTSDKTYHQNLDDGKSYIFYSDNNKYDDIFLSIKPVNIVEYNPREINERIKKGNGSITMLRDVYTGNQRETFCIIHINGYADSDVNNSIVYRPAIFTFTIPEEYYDNITSFEIVYFKYMRNNCFALDGEHDPYYTNIKDYFIEPDEATILCDMNGERGEDSLVPLNSKVQDDGTIVLENEKFYGLGHMYLVSRNQFIHERYVMDNNIIKLSSKFRTAYNKDKFLIYVDGRYMNAIDYRVILPAVDNPYVTERGIYFKFKEGIKHNIDVYYVGTPSMARTDLNGDLLINCIKTKATKDNMKRFKVPYPFRNYPHIYDAFFCIKHSVYVDKSEYFIDGDYIEFYDQEDWMEFGQDLIFVFPYYRPDWDNDGEVGKDDDIQFISYHTRLKKTIGSTKPTKIDFSQFSNKVDNSWLSVSYGDWQTDSSGSKYRLMTISGTAPGVYLIRSKFSVSINNIDCPKESVVTKGDEVSSVIMMFEDNNSPFTDYINAYPQNKNISQANSDARTIVFEQDFHGQFDDKMATHLFFNTTYIDKRRYTVNPTGNSVVMNENEVVPAGTMVTLVVETDYELYRQNNVILDKVQVTATEDPQYLFDIPQPDFSDSFFIIRGSVIVNPDRYFVTTDNKLLFVNKFDGVPKGRNLMFVFVKNKNNVDDGTVIENPTIAMRDAKVNQSLLHVKTEYMYFRPKEKTKSIHIPTNYYHRFIFSQDNIMLFVNSTYYNTTRYTVKNNVITLTNEADWFLPNKSVLIMIAYKVLDYKKVNSYIQNREIIYFTDVDEDIRNGAVDYSIPYPNPPFTDTVFMLSIGGAWIPESQYTISEDRQWIHLKFDPENMVQGHKLRFTFVHNKDFTYIAKTERSVRPSKGDVEIDIPSPYTKLVNLNRRMIVTYGNVYFDKDRYLIDNEAKKMLLLDMEADGERSFNFYFFHTGGLDTGSVAWLPESGYMCILREHIDRNFTKEMYLVYVNGKLVVKSQIMDIANNLKKVTTDIHTRYDLCVLNCSPLITEFKMMYPIKMDDWTNFLDPMDI